MTQAAPTDFPITVLHDQLTGLKHAGRDQILDCARSWLAAEKRRIKEEFLSSGDAMRMLADHTHAMDALLAALFALCCQGKEAPLAVVACGGYGRQALFPHSDIDIVFLHDADNTQAAAQIAEYILYMLWDMGLAVGQAHRSINDAVQLAKRDISVCTSLLDARLVVGNRAVFNRFRVRFEQDILADSVLPFVEAKLAEREERHRRFGDSRYVLEPNVKEGKGGLRDLHTLWWLARYIYAVDDFKELISMGLLSREEYRMVDRARQFLCRVRAHLHYAADRAEDRLTFDFQHMLAVAMGYAHHDPHRAVERFMRRYFSAVRMVGAATRVFCSMLEKEKKRMPRRPLGWRALPWKLSGFKIDGDRLNVRNAQAFERRPSRMIDLFYVSQLHGLDIHPHALQLIGRNLRRINRGLQRNPHANAVFLNILLADHGAETTLRKMSDAGVLGRFIPDFGRVIGQTQFNMYHVYTVDEHTLVAIGILHAIESGKLKDELPLVTGIIRRIQMRRVLYVALLCHDLAKGRGGDHSERGEAIVTRLARRFGFSADEVRTAAWLVRHHLLFSHTAFRRDINDPKTLQDFVANVQSIERLKLLLALTVADMRAVGPSVWNAWKASLLRELYRRAEQAISTGQVTSREQEEDHLRRRLTQLLPGWPKKDIDDYIEQSPSGFLGGVSIAHHAAIARMVKQADRMTSPVLLDTRHDYERSTTEITVCTPDQPGLFSKLAGALALSGANIIGAKIFTLKRGMAIDVFQVQDATGDVFDRPDRLAKMSVYIEQALAGELDLHEAFSSQRLTFGRTRRHTGTAEGQVFVENDASAVHTVIEITGQDRVGFLYQVTRALSGLGLSVSSAHISTYGAQVVDVFYVKDVFGMKVLHADKIRQVRDALSAVVNNPAFA